MSEGRTEALQKAFDNELYAFGVANGISVSLENIDAPTSIDTPYLNGFMLPAPTESADLYFTDMLSGIYQIDIHYASELGSGVMNRMIDKLNLAFKTGLDITRGDFCVTITAFNYGPLIVGSGILNAGNGWARKPVSITWITHTERL